MTHTRIGGMYWNRIEIDITQEDIDKAYEMERDTGDMRNAHPIVKRGLEATKAKFGPDFRTRFGRRLSWVNVGFKVVRGPSKDGLTPGHYVCEVISAPAYK